MVALACAPLARAGKGPKWPPNPVERPPLVHVYGDGSYTKASRGPHSIKFIIIHATDGGTLDGNVWWLSGSHSDASANYVISRQGEIVQLVNDSDIAWQAGNWKVNKESIGIEHVGNTLDPEGYTQAQYVSSAHLVAWLVRRYSVPVDRQHIIGHYQVPDPNHPGEFGGADHHTDPGPYWKWGYYMNLVRRFAFPERYALHVRITSLADEETLSGVVPWRISLTRPKDVKRVDFLVDGRLVWSDSRAPFQFAGGRGWNTTQIANGGHTLTVRAVGKYGTAVQRIGVSVHNNAFAVTTSAIRPWQKVNGVIRIHANVQGARTTGIGFYVDGKIISRDRKAPYVLVWNTHKVGDGAHRITIAATAVDGRVARRELILVVKNRPARKAAAKPKPKSRPLPPPAIVSQNVADGQTVSGTFTWRVHTTGPVAKLQFVVDGTVVATETREPWSEAWDTTTVADGQHTLEVRASTPSGTTATADVTVTVQQPVAQQAPTATTTTTTTP
jgi:N-acetyl-anhydromuramyl-L-alanine amidase AmpD